MCLLRRGWTGFAVRMLICGSKTATDYADYARIVSDEGARIGVVALVALVIL